MSGRRSQRGGIVIMLADWHEIFVEEGKRLVFCPYCPGLDKAVPLGRARTRCPRCGATLQKGKR